jgi:hypothetical protein
VILFFFNLHSFGFALFLLLLAGIAMGVNAVSTQTLRRMLATQKQFPEIVGLELVIGRFADAAISTLAQLTLLRGMMTFQSWLVVAAIFLAVNGLLHLRFVNGQKVAFGLEGGRF